MVFRVFKTTTSPDSPLDASGGTTTKPGVSDFITVQSFTNFAATTGAITAAWHSLQKLAPSFSALWVPYAFAGIFGLVSLAISLDGLKKAGAAKLDPSTVLGACFVAFVNSLVLAGAVVGTGIATRPGS